MNTQQSVLNMFQKHEKNIKYLEGIKMLFIYTVCVRDLTFPFQGCTYAPEDDFRVEAEM